MTPEQLEQLIQEGEMLNLEFKGEEKKAFSDRELVEAVICLANRPGQEPAWLLIGVEDDGRITGARPRHESGRTEPARLSALVAARTRPSLSVSARSIFIRGLEVLALEIPASMTPIGSTDGKYLRRALGGDGRPACLPMHFHEMQSHQADRGMLDYSALAVSGARWSDLDPLEFERFRRSIRERRGRGDESLLELPNEELAKVLGAVEANAEVRAVRVLGLLLFGKQEALTRLLPAHELAFQVHHGADVVVNDFFRWPLLRIIDEIEGRIRARNREQEVMLGMLRIGVPDYSERGLREALANALVHRDYTRLGAVHFQWFDDRIDIGNPGGLPEGVRLDNLLVTQPRPRNPLLADALKRAGLVERTARGIDTIFFEQLRNGRPAPSYAMSDQTSVLVSIPGGQANLDFIRLVAVEGQGGRVLALDELLMLNALWRERVLTTQHAAQLIQKPEVEARTVLHRLVEAGLVEDRGQKLGKTWHLSAAAYRRLGDKAAYVRQLGFEPLQQEQMVLQFAERHGAITRKDTAGLCQISGPQASRLLSKLVAKGLLDRIGERGRGVKYRKCTK